MGICCVIFTLKYIWLIVVGLFCFCFCFFLVLFASLLSILSFKVVYWEQGNVFF